MSDLLITLMELLEAALLLTGWALMVRELVGEGEMGARAMEAGKAFVGSVGASLVFLLSAAQLDWQPQERRSLVFGGMVMAVIAAGLGFSVLQLLRTILQAV